MIKVNNISYTIDGKNILSNINLNIIRNKITVITGKNGSGRKIIWSKERAEATFFKGKKRKPN